MPTTTGSNGALSPPMTSRSRPSTPKPKFPAEALRTWIKSYLDGRFSAETGDLNDRQIMKQHTKEISDKIKNHMKEIDPRGFKYIVMATISQNLGQAGRGDLSCHWEESDIAIQEMYSNDSVFVVVLAVAVRVLSPS